MTNHKQHITVRLAVLLLAFTLVLPSLVKLSHAIQHNHDHDVCIEKDQVHFHKLEYDCEFYKFKVQTQSTFNALDYELYSHEDNHHFSLSVYTFLSDYNCPLIALRGPPLNS